MLFGGIQLALGIKYIKIVGNAIFIACLCQLQTRCLRIAYGFLRSDLFSQRSTRIERIGDFTERDLNGLLIVRDGDVRADLRQIEGGLITTCIENR